MFTQREQQCVAIEEILFIPLLIQQCDSRQYMREKEHYNNKRKGMQEC